MRIFILPVISSVISSIASLLVLSACTPSNSGLSLSNSRPVGIVNGKTATEADVAPQAFAEPVVAIYTGVALCSGTLIAPDIVLTAAHCFEDVKQASDVIVMLHTLNILAATQPVTALGFRAAAYKVNEKYGQGPTPSSLDDLALIRLEHAVPAGTRIGVLPGSNLDYSTLTEVMAFGYGNADDRHSDTLEQSGAGTLRYTSFPLKKFEILPTNSTVDPDLQGMLAAVADTTAVCSGDSGGPLMASAAGVSSGVVVGVNDAVIAHFQGQQQVDFVAAAKANDLPSFYQKYPDAHDCTGGINLFIPVTRRLPWIQTNRDLLWKEAQGTPVQVPTAPAPTPTPAPKM